MNHVLEKGAIDEAVGQQEIDRVAKPRVVGVNHVERIAANNRSNP
jgi:hypothetical protein